MNRKGLILFLIACSFALHVFPQQLYSIGDDGELLEIDPFSCDTKSLGIYLSFIDLAITKNGEIYGTYNNTLYHLNTVDKTYETMGTIELNGQSFTPTGLVALNEIDLIGNFGSKLVKISTQNGTSMLIGELGWICNGDFVLIGNQLLMFSSSGEFILITLNDDLNEIVEIESLGFYDLSVLSMATIQENCFSDIKIIVFSDDEIFEFDINTHVLTFLCQIPGHYSWGAASNTIKGFDISKLNYPNVFTPNDDGINDLYYLYDGQDCSTDFEVNIEILNRWGKVVYQSNDLCFKWKGETIGGNPCSSGVYYCTIKISSNYCNLNQTQNTAVHLIR
ncbi:MAG: gliding motility-associated C-terminal domain-containing protein [Crocinitomicaceae bacterium]